MREHPIKVLGGWGVSFFRGAGAHHDGEQGLSHFFFREHTIIEVKAVFSSQEHTIIEVGVSLDGLSTTQLPAASAGASFHAAIESGKFLGDSGDGVGRMGSAAAGVYPVYLLDRRAFVCVGRKENSPKIEKIPGRAIAWPSA
jgi:hypothetical protein